MELLNVDRSEDLPSAPSSDGAPPGLSRLALGLAATIILLVFGSLIFARNDVPPPEPEPEAEIALGDIDDPAEAVSVLDDADVVITECVAPLPIGLPDGHVGRVMRISFAPQGSLVSFGEDDAVIWDPEAGIEIGRYDYGVDAVPLASPDGSFVVGLDSETDEIQLLDATTGDRGSQFPGNEGWARRLDPGIAPDSQSVVTMAGQGIDLAATVHDLTTGAERVVALQGDGTIMGAQSWFSVPVDGVLVALTRSRHIVAWNLEDGSRITSGLADSVDYQPQAVLGPNGTIIVLADREGTFEAFDLYTGASMMEQLGVGSISVMTVNHRQGLLAIAGNDAQGSQPMVRILDLASGDLVVEGEVDRPERLALSQDGSMLAWSDASGGVNVHRVGEGLPAVGGPLVGHSGSASAVAVSDDGEMVMTQGLRSVKQWELATSALSEPLSDRLLARIQTATDAQYEVAYDADIAVRVNGQADVWVLDRAGNTIDGRRSILVDGVTAGVSTNAEGTLVAVLVLPVTSSGEATIIASLQLLRVEDGKLLAETPVLHSGLSVADIDLSANGRHIALLQGEQVRFFCVV